MVELFCLVIGLSVIKFNLETSIFNLVGPTCT